MNPPLSAAVFAATAALSLSLHGPAHAAVVFTDTFDADAASSVLNFNAFNNWTVSGGTVDYIRSGGFGINCVGGSGGCVDMDGSSGDAGRLSSKTLFNFGARDTVFYSLTVDLSGNQRGGAPDTVTFGVEGGPQTTIALGVFEPFATYGFNFDFGAATSGRIIVEGAGGDNFGGILDNVVLSVTRIGALPEPGTAALLALVLAGIATTGGRRARRTTAIRSSFRPAAPQPAPSP
jgi:hypothetical protein